MAKAKVIMPKKVFRDLRQFKDAKLMADISAFTIKRIRANARRGFRLVGLNGGATARPVKLKPLSISYKAYRTKQVHFRTFKDGAGKERQLDRVYDEFTFGGRYTETNPEDLMEETLSLATNLGGIGWEELKAKGFARYTEVGTGYMNLGNATEPRWR